MPRWSPDAVVRLQDAAIELFEEHGFERITVAAIAGRAGLTERTFFNHFAGKRDVLFGPVADQQREIVVSRIAAAPDSLAPLDAVVGGLQAAADELLEGMRDQAIRRRRIVDATPELRERDAGKRAAMTAAVDEALRCRGLGPDAALLTARTGILVQQTAEQRWLQPHESRSLRVLLSDALVALRRIVD